MKAREQLLADLQALKRLFSKPKTWIKGWFAASEYTAAYVEPADDFARSSHSEDAVCFCLQGGIRRVVQDIALRQKQLHTALTKELPRNSSLTCFNDKPSTKKKDVLALIDRAIAKAVA